MSIDIFLKSKFPRDIFNEIKWKGYDLCKCKVYYINRGSPRDIATFEGDGIMEIGTVFVILMGIPYEKYIPYHRMTRIEYGGKAVFVRHGHVL